jgi:5-hydroxyisourate hydrolase-like protein (transthyretin family)
VRLTANHPKLKHGKPVTLSIAVVGSPGAGHKVHLQRLTKNKWNDVATTKLDSHGHGSYTVKPTKKGTYDYRVVDPATSTVKSGTSARVRVTAT